MSEARESPRLRSAAASDAAVIAEFNAAMARETEGKELDRARLEAGVRGLIDDASRGFYLLAERGGELVGQLMVTYEWSDWRNGTFWWIQSVFVRADHRRTGVYRALHDEVRRRAREAGACGLRLYVEQENAPAQATYRSLGMDATRYLLFEVEL